MEEVLVTVLVEAMGAVLAALIALAVRRLWSSAQGAPGVPAASPVRLFAVPAYA